jgi:hypothetical protein
MYRFYLFSDYPSSPSWLATPDSSPTPTFPKNHVSFRVIVNGAVHLLVPLKFVIIKGVCLPNITLLYDHITLSPVYDYTCLFSEKSALFIVMRRLMSVRCVLYDREFDFRQRQGFYPSLSKVLTGLQVLHTT